LQPLKSTRSSWCTLIGNFSALHSHQFQKHAFSVHQVLIAN
jgi:hypothetical protein